MLMDAFIKGDVYIDYPYEQAKFRYDKKSEKVYRRFYGEAEDEILHSSDLYNMAIRVGKQITREEYFRDPAAALVEGVTIDRNVSIAAALAQLKPCSWQEAEQRAQRLKASPVAQQALDAVAAGTSTVSAAARDRLRAGLDALCMDTEWTGPMVAWLDCLLRGQGAAESKTGITADGLVTYYLQDCLPLSNVISGCPVFDASEPDVPPAFPLAMIRQDATLVLPIADPDRASWLRAYAASLGMENLVVVEQGVEEQRDRALFQEIISRDNAPARTVLERTLRRMALGGRWFLLRARIDETGLQRLPQGTQFVQAIAIPAPGLEAPRQILHIATGVGQMAAVPMHEGPHDPAPVPREEPSRELAPHAMIDRSRWRDELQARFSPSKTWPGPEVEDGWKDLLCDLADALDATGVRYSFVNLENHAGALRCILGSAEDEPRMEELHDLVDRARERSRLTCPRCGKSGCACPASLTVADVLKAARLTLERIEAEMKRIGFWSENPPSLLDQYDRGELRTYLDAPSFEQWLQCVFLARAQEAVKNDALPSSSSVAEMARRQYDFHSHVPEAQPLLQLLRAFDLLVDQRGEAGREPPQRHVRDDRPEAPPQVREAVSAGGRVLKKGTWKSSGWPCVNVEPWDDRYFRRALQHIADQFGIPVPEITDDAEDPDPRGHAAAGFVLEGVRVSAMSGRRCSFAAPREDVRDRIFASLLRLAI